MWTVALRGLLARKLRLAMTVLTVVLGVGFLSGVLVLTDTVTRSFAGLFDDAVSGVDLVVRSRSPFGAESGRVRFDDSELTVVRALDGVADAAGFVQGYAQLVDRSGRAIQSGGFPTLGISWSQPGRRGPLRLVADGTRPGRPPRSDGEVAIDAGTARRHGLHVGDTVRVLLPAGQARLRVVGWFALGDQPDTGGVTFSAFDLDTAQRVLGADRTLDAIYVDAAPGVERRALRARLAAELGPAYEVSTAAEVADDRGEQVRGLLDVLGAALLGIAGLGVVVGALVILNTFSILVAQRTRELGLLRLLGATPRQVVAAILAEGLVVGVLGSMLGLAVGVGVAAGLVRLLGAVGFDVPGQSLVLAGRTVMIGLAVGTAATVLAAAPAARRAARVAPVEAVVLADRGAPRSSGRRATIGLVLLAIGLVVLAAGAMSAGEVRRLGAEVLVVVAGAVLVLLGVLVVLGCYAGRLAGALGTPMRRLGAPGALARANAGRNPRRSAATASALVVGLALVGLVAVFAASAKASTVAAVDRGIRADLVLRADGFGLFSTGVADRVRAVPEVDAVAAFRFGYVRVGANAELSTAVEPTDLAAVVDLNLRSGRIGALDGSSVLVSRGLAAEHGAVLGATMSVQFPTGFRALRVVGIYEQEDFTGGFPVALITTPAVYDAGFGPGRLDMLVYAATSGDPDRVRASVDAVVSEDFPNVEVLTRDQYRDEQERAIDELLAMLVALLALSEIIGVLGIANALALATHERMHELGILRALGMSRRQLRAMVRGEALIVAAIGAVLGLGLGVVWGWALTGALAGQGISRISFPWAQLVGLMVASLVAGLLAAWLPAWRASRLDVVDALAAE